MKTSLQHRSWFCFSGAKGNSVCGTTRRNLYFHTGQSPSHSSVFLSCSFPVHRKLPWNKGGNTEETQSSSLQQLCLKCKAVAGEEEEFGSQLLCVTGTEHSTRAPCSNTAHPTAAAWFVYILNTLLHQHLAANGAAPTKRLVKLKKCQIPKGAWVLPLLEHHFSSLSSNPHRILLLSTYCRTQTPILCVSWYETCHAETQPETVQNRLWHKVRHCQTTVQRNNCARQATGNCSDFFFKSCVGNCKIFKFQLPSSSLELHQKKEWKIHIIFHITSELNHKGIM